MKAKLNTLSARVASLPNRLPTAQPGSWRAGKTSSTARGYGYAWQKARAGFLLEHPYCAMCLTEMSLMGVDEASVVIACAERRNPLPIASVVDHKVPHRGDQRSFWDRCNWQSLCAHHHSAAKQKEEAGF